jgi:hypothetical protein
MRVTPLGRRCEDLRGRKWNGVDGSRRTGAPGEEEEEVVAGAGAASSTWGRR